MNELSATRLRTGSCTSWTGIVGASSEPPETNATPEMSPTRTSERREPAVCPGERARLASYAEARRRTRQASLTDDESVDSRGRPIQAGGL